MNSEWKWRKQKLLMRIQGWLWKIFFRRVVFPAFLSRLISLRLKTSIVVLFALLFSSTGFLHGQSSGNDTSQTENVPSPTPYSIVEQDANSQVWERTVYELDPSGNPIPKIHHYTELATGLNYLVNGQWVASSEEINILPNGTAAATNGQHQAYFPGDIYQGQIEVVTPDGLQLFSQPVGLSYFDGTNSVLIAQLTNSVGVLVSSNQIVYPNAFTDFKADLRYTYKKSGFEQEVVFQEQLPSPESFGLNPQVTRLQLLTEFFNTADPTQTTASVDQQDGLQDTTLTFGAMTMIQGKAFSIGNQETSPTQKTPVYKNWEHLDGQAFLVEELPYQQIEAQLEQLPVPSGANTTVSLANPVLHKISAKRLLPPTRQVQASTNKVQLAKAKLNYKSGVVLDYDEIDSEQTNFTFQGDTTYYIGDYCYLLGTTTIEGGTVIKEDGEVEIDQNGTVVCQTGPYRPGVFTSVNDNSVGETIDSSSGSPQCNDVGTCLEIAGTNISVHDLRFSYFTLGIDQEIESCWVGVTNCQFFNGDVAVESYGAVELYNVLISAPNSGDGSVNLGTSLIGENVTADGGTAFVEGGSTIALTNCIITSQPLTLYFAGTLLTNHTTWLASLTAPVYQTIGAGSYYLTNGSPYHNAGTTNISPALLAELRQKTTYPPIVYSNTTISIATTFYPQAQRDNAGNPDLGYHYDPIDYFFGDVNANSNLTFTVGTAVGWFDLSTGPGYGITPNNNVTVTFNGTATSPCFFARYDTVQEGGNGNWTDQGWLAGIAGGGSGATNNIPVLTALFTHFSHLSGDPNHFRDGQFGEPLVIQTTDCELLGNFGGYNMLGSYTNCLFDRVNFSQETASAYPYAIFRNCTFHGGSVDIVHDESSYYGDGPPFWYSSVRDSAFDSTTFSIGDPFGVNTNYADYNFNAFLLGAAQLSPEGTNNVVVTNSFNWQTSWFGNYYQSTNSLLINKGDRTADQIGLYHFTTQTNQVPETNSIVDIGYHYVATDTSGIPLDSNGDGIPDYIEDANGNGLVDSGEIGWNITGDLGLQVIITQPRNGSSLP